MVRFGMVNKRPACGRGSRHLCLALALAALSPACAERIGQKAAQGAMSELRTQNANRTGPPPARVAAENAVGGVMAALDNPEQQARIQRLIAQAVSAATETVIDDVSRQLVAQLGPDGSGPLAVSLSQAGQRVSASVAGGVVGGVVDGVGTELASMAPECAGPDRAACLERRLQQTTRTTAATFTKGVRDTIGWQLLLVAFALGALGGMLGSWLLSLRHERRSLRTA
jgi:hypothetical protein